MVRTLSVAAALVVLTAPMAQAQGPFGLELRGGAAFPTQDLGDATLETGLGIEGIASFRVLPHVSVYGAWAWYRFEPETSFSNGTFDVEDTGYNFGLRFTHPIVNTIGGWLQGGGVYRHMEFEDADGDVVADTGHEFGWEIGGGVRVPLRSNLALTPGVRYRTFTADVTFGQTTTELDLSYLAAEVGLSWTFGGPRRATAALAR